MHLIHFSCHFYMKSYQIFLYEQLQPKQLKIRLKEINWNIPEIWFQGIAKAHFQTSNGKKSQSFKLEFDEAEVIQSMNLP